MCDFLAPCHLLTLPEQYKKMQKIYSYKTKLALFFSVAEYDNVK